MSNITLNSSYVKFFFATGFEGEETKILFIFKFVSKRRTGISVYFLLD